MRRATLKGDALLLITAAIWGSGFVAQRLGMDHVGPMTFNAIRFAIGLAVLLPVIRIRSSARNAARSNADRILPRSCLIGGVLAGLVFFVAAGLQQTGIVYTTAGKAGFITGLNVVIVPLICLGVGRRSGAASWVGAALAAVGLYFLSAAGSLDVNRGDWFVLGCAFFWAVHILVIGHYATRTDPLKLAAVQFATGAVLSALAALVSEEITVEGIVAARWAVLYSGAFSVGIAFTLQVVGQRRAPPAHAAVLLSLESVFAALCGWLVLSETLTQAQILGCALMLLGTLVSRLLQSHNDPADGETAEGAGA